MNIVVADYGAGNVASVERGLRQADLGGALRLRLTRNPADVGDADAVLIPGVGHFQATRVLDGAWRNAIVAHVQAGRALLGICLGMQWLFDGSDEAQGTAGLGLFAGVCFDLAANPDPDRPPLRVPHVGWNTLDARASGSRLLAGVAPGATAYFTHSFAAPVVAETAAVTTHGRAFSAVVERGMVFGTQFHPEKSGRIGRLVLANFLAAAEAAASDRSRPAGGQVRPC